MDCLLCYKVYLKEKEFENYHPDPQVWKRAIVKLFGLSNDLGLSEDLIVCLGCHLKLEEVEGLVDQLEEPQRGVDEVGGDQLKLKRRVDEAKIEIKQELIESKEKSQAMAESTSANRMSPSSQDRCTLLRAIDDITPPQAPAPVMDQVYPEEDSNGPIGENSMDGAGGILVQNESPETRAQIRGMELESVQGPSRPPTGSNEPERIDLPSGSKTKGGYGLRKRTPTQKRSYVDEDSSDSDEESSNEDSGSESESGDDDSSSEGENKARIKSNGSGIVKKGGDNTKRGPASIKEFTILKNASFKCKHCAQILTRKKGLWTHLLIHRPPRFDCSAPGCGKRFTQKTSLDSHLKNVHEKKKEFKCTRRGCGKLFGVKGSLTSHVKVVHDGKKDYKCQVGNCVYASGSKRNLNRHKLAKHK